MRITASKSLRATKLETSELNKVGGGRGTCCGVAIHCSNCGGTAAIASLGGYDPYSLWFAYTCPNCYAAYA